MEITQLWKLSQKYSDYTFEDLCVVAALVEGLLNKDSPHIVSLMRKGIVVGKRGDKVLLDARVSKMFKLDIDYALIAKTLIEIYPQQGHFDDGRSYQTFAPKKTVLERLAKMGVELEGTATVEAVSEVTKRYIASKSKNGRYVGLPTLANYIYDKDKGSTLGVLLMKKEEFNNTQLEFNEFA